MRQITSHKVPGNEANEVDIIIGDEPGAGGANHKYVVYATPDLKGMEYAQRLAVINFQNGPIPINGINGVTQEVLLAVVADRLQSFQSGPFPCKENEAALAYVTEALEILKGRTRDRIARAVEGQLKA